MKQYSTKFAILAILITALLTLGQCKVLIIEKAPNAGGQPSQILAKSGMVYPASPAKRTVDNICNGGPVNSIIVYAATGFPLFGVSQKVEFLCE